MFRRLADLRIGAKLYLGFGAVLALLLVVAGIGVVRLGESQKHLDDLASSGLVSVETADQVMTALVQARLDLANAALTPDAAGTEKAIAALDADQKTIDEHWKDYLATSPASSAAQQKAFTDGLAAWRATLPPLLALAKANDLDGFVDQRTKVATPAAQVMTTALQEIVKVEAAAATAMSDDGAAAYRAAVVMLVVCALFAAALAVAIAVAVARSTARPLARVLAVVEGMAAGRLDARVKLDRQDEVGRLAAATDTSLDALSAAMREIRDEATALNASSSSLSSVSVQLSSGAQEAAAQTQVVSAASEEVTVSISTVAAAGEEMTAAIAQIATATSEASQMASSAVAAAGAAGGAIERLGVSSKEIGDVVKLITSIAEQTNLLALNATIEAARAGELGKGFAVVAGEVKELARQTAQATDEIIGKVSATQGDAASAASAVTQIGDVIARIDEVQATIAAAVEEQSATTSEMVRNVTEISTGSEQISANISSIAEGTEQNRASAGMTASAATDVTASAAKLTELTGRFVL
ncbi:methyl-accepting chemotaxis sensory transducer with TarH sensor [Quadrisphaera granulorum]|uniref:Methyl-accepting chemotaxis sensory transducer with TarH sensor n=1 Tax=Quadrisphaera granulorum TaxID=317664 RepID=A0A316A5P2_9ACTN|nr:methyl-accepting chemotaxis protein [Quadrisphaera granulorum]PWJ53005.1 methyl-accepting chemotaxis sensory transducer with TarH sensor [Quadrisphaera granulorum]SZE97170.1 methyl-accepting chemotaxis sensory transducer with TarH sensor [Quadrisphaera granulorum]